MPMEKVGPSDAISKREFHSRLRSWLLNTQENMIGDAERGQEAWVHVLHAATVYRLNSDTKRAGVAEYLELVNRHGDDLKWSTTQNRDGKPNAVAYGPDASRIQRFYLYSTE